MSRASTPPSQSLADRCRHNFLSETARRGRDYFATGRVALNEGDGDVTASVRGSGGRVYYVSLVVGFRHELDVSCTCPYFEREGPCKHLYATVLALDNDDPHFFPGNDVVVFYEQASSQRDYMHTFAPAKAPQPWQNLLSVVRQARSSAPVPARENLPATGELRYLLSTNAAVADRPLRVSFFTIRRKKDGTWVKPKPVRLSHDLAQGLPEPDKTIVSRLFYGQNSIIYDHYYDRDDGESDCGVGEELYALVMEPLCKTGRLFASTDGEATPLLWDAGDPYRFVLDLKPQPKTGKLVVDGQLVRGEHGLAVSELAWFTGGGLFLHEGKLKRLEGGGMPWMQALRVKTPVVVPNKARDSIIAEAIGTADLDVRLCKTLGWTIEERRPTPVVRFQKSDGLQAKRLCAELLFDYGIGTVPATLAEPAVVGGKVAVRRDRTAERTAALDIERLGAQPVRHGVGEDYWVYSGRFVELVNSLLEKGWRVEAEGQKVRAPGTFEMSISSGVDWFDLDARLDYDGASATLPAILNAAKKKSPFVRLSDGSQGVLPKTWLARYEKILRLGKLQGEMLHFSSAQALFLDALIEEQRDARVDRTFARLRQQLARATQATPSKEPRGFCGKLRPYQREGLAWLKFLQTIGFGGCLADDMGLGKTVQVLALLMARRNSRKRSDPPSLVVVPCSLVHNWIEEAKRFAPSLRVVDHTGTQRDKTREGIERADLVVTTYGTLRQDIRLLTGIAFDYVILDEAQAMKNAKTRTAKACRVLRAEHRLAMTGTPVENHLGELGSIFEFLNPGMLDPQTLRELSRDFHAGSGGIELLARSLKPFLLRRTKDEVLDDLPPKTEQTLLCQLTAGQKKTYDELSAYYRQALDKRIAQVGFKRSGIQILEALLRLRQAACHPGLIDHSKADEPSAKLDALIEQLSEAVDGGHKVLVFSQFTRFLSLVRAKLDARKVSYAYLDGKTRNRQRVVDRFQSDADCRAFLISLKAGGHGLNLTAGDYVFLLDPWWNPAVEAQAIDRAHRIGQQNPVFAYRLVAQDTVEEKILQLQDKKRDLANSIYAGGNASLASLTPEDVKLLLS